MRFSKTWRFVIAIPLVFLALICLIVVLALLQIPSQKKFDGYSLPESLSTLEQNWSDDIRQQFHFTGFGSKIMPYDLFMNLEQATSDVLLSDNQLMKALGFITQDKAANNPDGLPVGFTHTGTGWIGISCAACHTGLLSFEGTRYLIDGAPGMLNFSQFESEISTALNAHLNDHEKFQRLAQRMGAASEKEQQSLKNVIEARATFFDRRLYTNRVDVDYGYGRLDAFGRIFNAVTSAALEMPENYHQPDAPVSIPMLWDASHFDLVQWNGSAPNKNPGPLGQNVTTALAVYGEINMLEKGWGYKSSVDIVELGYIQSKLYDLMSPKWDESIFGDINDALAEKGKNIYVEQCKACHELIDDRDPKRKIRAKLVDTKLIGTDPLMAKNFATFTSKTGPLEGKDLAIVAGETFGEEAATINVVINATIGAILRRPIDTITAYVTEDADVYSAKLDLTRQAYKARPLNGIWATGPFLHNGSVPTIYDLLKGEEERPKQFYVGGSELDAKHLGMRHDNQDNTSLFDTSLPGNANTGHTIATSLRDEDKWALIEYLKTL
ncbi:MAG: hypothetical protein K6L76_05190 [Agarilytica sp.]